MHKIPYLLNAFIKFIQCYEVPGKYRLYEATKVKNSRCLITYHIKGHEFSIPWDQWCFWKNYGPENYYLEEIIPFTDTLNKELEQFDLFDLGADVGVVSALVNKYCDGLKNIYAVEPNPSVYSVLEQNLKNISLQYRAFHQAISDFNGYATFTYNKGTGSDHEGHIVKDSTDNGVEEKTKVTTLDDLIADNNLAMSENIAIKIDVEGQEKAMLTGGKQTIKRAINVILLLEIHPEVLQRDKQTPEEILKEAEKIREFTWIVPIEKNKEIDRTKKFFEQFPSQQYDIIGISKN